MTEPKHYARIAITLPEKDLQAADRLARTQDRSRSWIVAEAIRRYAASLSAVPEKESPSVVGVSLGQPRAPSPTVRDGLGPSRLAQLTSDMKLTPEQRVLAAEETLRQQGATRPRRHHVLAFDRYEDFLDWKKTRGSFV